MRVKSGFLLCKYNVEATCGKRRIRRLRIPCICLCGRLYSCSITNFFGGSGCRFRFLCSKTFCALRLAMSEVYLSRDGYAKLKEELKELKETERPTVRQALQRAREFGDLSENAEYAAAKERLMFLEQRISKLEDTLSRATLLENEAIPEDKVYIGATVELVDLKRDRELTYMLVAPEEADFEAGKISTTSPIGKGLLGHSEGEEVEIKVPAGVLNYRIVKISR